MRVTKSHYSVTFDFNITDREKLLAAYKAIVPEIAEESPEVLDDDNLLIKTVMTNIDVLALLSKAPVGWLDLGLERIASVREQPTESCRPRGWIVQVDLGGLGV